ncbi:MFS transporter [Acidisoma silvae]|uniref:MFS transporter n=1 Tax=Acidisoma silvae TaxID=2802396 RepID=A0A963YWW5_9PROT|nr:MFS transporter [Acidisoma silvae]
MGAGLIGVLLAVLVAGFNEHVTEIDLPDLGGALGIGYDNGTWLTAIYEACNVSAMAFAPWCAATFSLRRFTITVTGLLALLAAFAPFMPDLDCLYILRAVQGLAGGSLPPMLMSVALRYLPPKIKIYGLGAYALSATCGPNLATPLAALCFETFGWQSVFWEPIPLCLASMALVFYGIPQDPLRLERFRQFNWSGLLLGFPAISMIVIALMQGDRLDWFQSSLIWDLTVCGIAFFALFLVNEWSHPLPFFKIQMLRNRNLSFSLIALAMVLVLAVANVDLPSRYLAELQSYRPWQTAPLMLALAIPQLVALPLVAALCNFRQVDCRWVMALGLLLMAGSVYAGTFVTSDWYRGNFYWLQAMQVLGQPMAVIPILMIATLTLAPTDGPFVSGMFNMVKGFANAIAAGILSFLFTWREHLHSNILLDHYGASRFLLSDLTRNDMQLASTVHQQATVMAIADSNWIMIGIALGLLVLLTLIPSRVYPPSAPAAAKLKTASSIPSTSLSSPSLAR